MSITISPTAEDLRATADRLALRVADLVAERDVAIGEARDGVATARRFKDGRDHALADADEARQAGLDLQRDNAALVAAAFVLVADSIRREEELAAQLAAADGKAKACERIITAQEGLLEDLGTENRRLSERVTRSIAADERLRAELDAEIHANRRRHRRRFRRRR